MVDKLRGPGAVIAIITVIPVVQWCSTRSNNVLVEVVIRVGVAVVKPGMVIEMIMSCKICAPALSGYAVPKCIPVARIIIKAVRMVNFERRLMAKNKDVRLIVCSKLYIQPGLVDTGIGYILIESDYEDVVLCE